MEPIVHVLDLRGRQPVLIVMGVSGSGKSTLAAVLARQLGWDFQEGDDLHPAENVEKMAAGIPLDDEDRWPWLDAIASWVTEHAGADVPGIITCSALKRSYRDRLREQNAVFVHVRGVKELIGRRMSARVNHFMPAGLLDSQLATLEPLGADEQAIEIDAGRLPAEQAAVVMDALGLRPVAGSSALGAPHPGTPTARQAPE
jgi:gluconokinase